MDIKDRIYIAPVRGRLPRRYEVISGPLPSAKQKWRWFGAFCLICAAFWGAVYWIASR